MIGHVTGLALLLLALAAGEVGAQVIPPTAAPTLAPASRPRLGEVRNWAYQLQRIDPDRIARSPYDLVVIDYSRNGEERGRLSPEDVKRMQTRPDGGRRTVLAYLSVGEAEDYRYYWRDEWTEAVIVLDEPDGIVRSPRAALPQPGPDRAAARFRALRLPKLGAPAWLGRENEGWPGNFLVRYWDPGWQRLLFGDGDSYLSRLLAAGFDGVYLDRLDTFEEAAGELPTARQDMVRLVMALAERARRMRPGFLVVVQNGEQLLSDPAYLGTIDAIAKEDLLYNDGADGQRNSIDTVSRSMRLLAPARNRGLPVLVVEYVREPALVEALRADILGRGFVPYFGVRALDRIVLPEDLLAPPVPPVPALTSAPAQGVAGSFGGTTALPEAAPVAAIRPPAKASSTAAGRERAQRRPPPQRPAAKTVDRAKAP